MKVENISELTKQVKRLLKMVGHAHYGVDLSYLRDYLKHCGCSHKEKKFPQKLENKKTTTSF